MTKGEAIQRFRSKKVLGVHRSLISKLPDQLPTKYSDRTTLSGPGSKIPKGWRAVRRLARRRGQQVSPADDVVDALKSVIHYACQVLAQRSLDPVTD